MLRTRLRVTRSRWSSESFLWEEGGQQGVAGRTPGKRRQDNADGSAGQGRHRHHQQGEARMTNTRSIVRVSTILTRGSQRRHHNNVTIVRYDGRHTPPLERRSFCAILLGFLAGGTMNKTAYRVLAGSSCRSSSRHRTGGGHEVPLARPDRLLRGDIAAYDQVVGVPLRSRPMPMNRSTTSSPTTAWRWPSPPLAHHGLRQHNNGIYGEGSTARPSCPTGGSALCQGHHGSQGGP